MEEKKINIKKEIFWFVILMFSCIFSPIVFWFKDREHLINCSLLIIVFVSEIYRLKKVIIPYFKKNNK